MRPQRFERLLNVPLTETEKLNNLQKLSEIDEQKMKLEYEKKTALDEFKAQFSEIEEKMRKLFNETRNNSRLADVFCLEYLDEETKQVITIREDTGEVIDVRDCKPHEFQPELITEETEKQKDTEAEIKRVRESETIDKLTEFCFEYSEKIGREVTNEEVLSWSDEQYKAVQAWLMLVIYATKNPEKKILVGEMPDVLRSANDETSDTSAGPIAENSDVGEEENEYKDYKGVEIFEVEQYRLRDKGDIVKSRSLQTIPNNKLAGIFEFGDFRYAMTSAVYGEKPIFYAYRVLTPGEFAKEFPEDLILNYQEKTELPEDHPQRYGYHGVKVTYKSKDYILAKPEVGFTAQPEPNLTSITPETAEQINLAEDERLFLFDGFVAVVKAGEVPKDFTRYAITPDALTEINFYKNELSPAEYINVEKHNILDPLDNVEPPEGFDVFSLLTLDESKAVKVFIESAELPVSWEKVYWDDEFNQAVFIDYQEKQIGTAKIIRAINGSQTKAN